MATTLEQVKEMKRRRNELLTTGQQLYAKIRSTSEYAHQNPGGEPFPVRLMPVFGAYAVQGGPGGQYRLTDVELFVIENGVELKIS